MKRSIITEKITRRGYHLSREYGVDPLETVTVAEVMTELPAETANGFTDRGSLPLPETFAFPDETCRAVAEEMATTGMLSMPVVDRKSGILCGNIGAANLLTGRRRAVRRESERRIAFLLESQPE